MSVGPGPAPPSAGCVRVLLGEAHAAMGLRCLSSMVAMADRAFEIVVHDDGTLSERAADRLRDDLPVREVVRRADADRRMKGVLAGSPACAAFRAQSPLALKLLDVVALEEGPRVRYVDSDVLFVRRFRLADLLDGDDALFMMDCQDAYSVRSWHLLRRGRLSLVHRVNTGFVGYPREQLDLRRIEAFLAEGAFRRSPMWVEQTAWAAAASRTPTRLLHPRQFVVPRRAPVLDAQTIAIHFVTPVRRYLWERSWDAPTSDTGPARVRTVRARRCSPGDLLRSEAQRLGTRITRHVPGGRASCMANEARVAPEA